MKLSSRVLCVVGLVLGVLFGSGSAWADKVSLKADLSAAREKLLSMVSGGGDPATLKTEIATLSGRIDAEADSVPGFKPIWVQFKTNRDTKIIPAFDGTRPGDKEAAKALAGGEQKELFGKMMELLK